MFKTFRLSMTWLHTWFGLVLGYVLMVVFFFGALAIFDREIDRWAMPHTRFDPQPLPSFDRVIKPRLLAARPETKAIEEARTKGTLPENLKPKSWGVYSGPRDPVTTGWVEFEGKLLPGKEEEHQHGEDSLVASVDIDPRTGKLLPSNLQPIGSGWFYPMHFTLQLLWMDLGIWIVGLAAMAMMAALVSGVVMHKKIFREFFTFRPAKAMLRSTLDLHNLTGVVALPFHFMFALSGLVIFAGIYMPAADKMLAKQVEARTTTDAAAKHLPEKPAGASAELASVDAMVAQAEHRWAERGMPGKAVAIQITHVGDANAYVSVTRSNADRVATNEAAYFDGASGRLLFEEPSSPPVTTVRGYIAGLHLIGFKHWTLRWLYFVGALASCACIATGFIFFVEKRKRTHAKQGVSGARWVDALAVTTVTGMLIATLAMLVVNRLLPVDWVHRGDWETGTFWAAWALALLHASWRSAPVRQARRSPAWHEQCWAVAVLGFCAVLLNWVSTGDHLGKTLLSGYWPVAGVDLILLASATVAALTGIHLSRKANSVVAAANEGSSADGDTEDSDVLDVDLEPTPATSMETRHA